MLCHNMLCRAVACCAVLQVEFEALRQAGAAPAMFIATPYDLHTSRW
jgi:hypothetical protein